MRSPQRGVLGTVLISPLRVQRKGGGVTPPQDGTVGATGLGGVGNWPTATDRALVSSFTLVDTATITQFNMRTTAGNGAGERYKGLLYAADGAAGRPGTLLAVSAASSPVGAGVQLVTMAVVGSPIITPQAVWIGYTAAGEGSGETISGAAGAARTIMFNAANGISFASPNDPAPVWAGGPGPYDNVGAFWWDYTF